MKSIFLLISFISVLHTAFSQENQEPKGKASGKVFFKYHVDTTKDAEQTSAFELNRAYLGYSYKINDKFSAKILLDAGKGSSGSDYSVFIKNAKLDYKAQDWLTFTAGVFGLKQFKDQENFWGYRYIYKALADEYKFGSSADLGFMAAFKINKQIKVDVLIVNGEGYKKLQDTSGKNRYGLNFVYTPTSNWIFKVYYDNMKGIDIEDENQNTNVSNYSFFAAYKIKNHFRIGVEYNLLQDAETYKKASKGKDLQGISFYSTYIINSKWNIFGRYDNLSSNTLSGEDHDWNFNKDGGTYIGGLEYKPIKLVNLSANFRYTDFEDNTMEDASAVYVNLEFKF